MALPRAARLASHGFCVALVLLAWVLAHRIAYAIGSASSHDGASGHVADHGYLPLLELAAAGGALVTLAAFAIVLWRDGRRGVLAPCLVCLPARLLRVYSLGATACFAFAELAERSFAGAPPMMILVLGLALQAVLSCLAVLAARRLLRRVGESIVALPAVCRRPHAATVRVFASEPSRPRIALLAGGHAGRAPPTA